jgi:hypothetical protein
LLFAGDWANGLPAGEGLDVRGAEADWAAFRAAFRLDPGPVADA